MPENNTTQQVVDTALGVPVLGGLVAIVVVLLVVIVFLFIRVSNNRHKQKQAEITAERAFQDELYKQRVGEIQAGEQAWVNRLEKMFELSKEQARMVAESVSAKTSEAFADAVSKLTREIKVQQTEDRRALANEMLKGFNEIMETHVQKFSDRTREHQESATKVMEGKIDNVVEAINKYTDVIRATGYVPEIETDEFGNAHIKPVKIEEHAAKKRERSEDRGF